MTPAGSILLFGLASVFVVQGQGNPLGYVSGVMDIIKVAKDVTIFLAKAWDLVDERLNFGEVPLPILDRTETKLFGKIERINLKLDNLASTIDNLAIHSMTTILHTLPERVRLELRLNDLLDYLTRMDTNYRRMQKYSTEQKNYERMTLEDFAESVISHDASSVVNLVERIHAFVVPNGRGISSTGLFDLLSRNMQTHYKTNENWKNSFWTERLMVNDQEEGLQRAGWIKPKKSLVMACKNLLLRLKTEKDGELRSKQLGHDVTILSRE